MSYKIKLTIKANNNNWGSVSVAKLSDKSEIIPSNGDIYEVDNGEMLYMEPKENKGYKFMMWSDGVYDKTRVIQASEDSEYEAVYSLAESNVLLQMFNHLFYDGRKRRYIVSSCPEPEKFSVLYNDTSIPTINENAMPNENQTDAKSSKYLNYLAWLIPIFIAIALLVIILMPIKCHATNTDSIVVLQTNTANTPLFVPITANTNNYIYARKIIVDTTYVDYNDTLAPKQKSNKAITHGEILYRNTGWHKWLYFIITVVLLSIVLVLIFRAFLQYLDKVRECENQLKELKYKDNIRIFNETRDIESLRYKTDMLLYEKREKMKLDEWARDNEHYRKMDVKELERMAELNNVLLELAKIKNTITIKSAKNDGETMIIERSILSEDCCQELKEIVKEFISNKVNSNNSCC